MKTKYESNWDHLHELAGIAGVDPGPLTPRELDIMARGRLREQWNHETVAPPIVSTGRLGARVRRSRKRSRNRVLNGISSTVIFAAAGVFFITFLGVAIFAVFVIEQAIDAFLSIFAG